MANGHGGSREGAGRKHGAKDKPIYIADPADPQPLDYLLAITQGSEPMDRDRFDAAKAAAPYCHARLQNTQLDVDHDINVTLVSYLDADLPAQP